jgi:hypothetical protein
MGMAIDRLQSGDARELDGPCSAAFVSSSAAVRTARHFVVRLGDGLCRDGRWLTLRRQLSAIGKRDRLGKTRDQDTTQPRNRTGIQTEL